MIYFEFWRILLVFCTLLCNGHRFKMSNGLWWRFFTILTVFLVHCTQWLLHLWIQWDCRVLSSKWFICLFLFVRYGVAPDGFTVLTARMVLYIQISLNRNTILIHLSSMIQDCSVRGLGALDQLGSDIPGMHLLAKVIPDDSLAKGSGSLQAKPIYVRSQFAKTFGQSFVFSGNSKWLFGTFG